MPRFLEETVVDLESDAVDLVMTEAEEAEARQRFAPTLSGPSDPDLTDGGMVNGARLTPMQNGRPVQTGRAAARRAWTWDGRETVLTLAWNPDGNVHDGGRRYLQKRVCLCCKYGGFKPNAKFGSRCPNCVKNNCTNCKSSTDMSRSVKDDNGKVIRGWIIPCNYLRKADVPFQAKFYGDVDCFLESCPRRGGLGFKTPEDMRMHARGVHGVEYQIWQEVTAASRNDEVQTLKEQLNAIMLQMAANPPGARGRPSQRKKRLAANEPPA